MEHIELNQDHVGLRVVIAGVLLVLGLAALAYGVTGLLNPELGWQTVQVNTSAGATCGDDFALLYEAGSRAELNAVTGLYSDACRKAFQLFHSDQEFEGVVNVTAINRHPNQELEVDGALYEALAAAVSGGRRELYLGPVYERYDDLFYCQEESQLTDFDPRLSEAVREEYTGVLAYANDPRAIDLELLGGNRVRLKVSEDYLAKAEQEGIGKFIDFSWMRNAFVADYLAGELMAGGYTSGVLNSYDGFTRNLDSRGVEYAYPLYHRWGSTVYSPGELRYCGAMSLVRMRDYPTSGLDAGQYYALSNGEIRTMYLDPADALCKSAVDTLLCYSREKGCAEILLEMVPVYIADEFREDAAAALAGKGIDSIWCQEAVVLYTEPEAVLANFYADGGVQYTAKQIIP